MFIELQNDKTYDTCSLVNKLRPSMKVNDCELNYSKVKTYENESLLLDENLKQITEKIEEEFNEYSSETSFFKKELLCLWHLKSVKCLARLRAILFVKPIYFL